ncbi:hypothetical protein [Faecalibacter bovis]|uniref:DUF4350 domain-containing protein n=1 Tax=Faecalibacter bovis TaxID=2898187 RepID=A0ABX7XB78_9FLAO|nr:hypothetical protein [Faecalibacter bovis]QTV05138.1 hypothetical protein J9309_10120 [Faecalibacter bovis]
MNGKLIKILVGFFILSIGCLILLAIFSTPKTNWEIKFKKESKSPFGLYILYNDLQHLTGAKKVIEVKNLEDLKDLNPKTDVIFYIDTNNKSSFQVLKEINDLNKREFKLFYADSQNYNSKIIEESTKTKINTIELEIYQNRYTNEAKYFNSLKNVETIGTVTIRDSVFTNFMIEKNNKMVRYTHADPLLFSNFYLLNPEGYAYAKESLKPLNNKNVYWINPDRSYATNDNNLSPLSFILSQPELKAAWYVLLAAIFLYLIFKSKREQKIIPIVNPEKNLSLEYSNVIASMYYESGKPQDIIKKKIDYFYYTLRKQFNIATDNVFDEHFIYVLAQKAQITEAEVVEFITELDNLYQNPKTQLKDVNRTYHIIENYKTKAHII